MSSVEQIRLYDNSEEVVRSDGKTEDGWLVVRLSLAVNLPPIMIIIINA